MEKESDYMKINKVFVTGLVSLCVGALGSAAKAYIDVVELKTKVQNFEDNQTILRDDIKEIKQDVKTLLSKGG